MISGFLSSNANLSLNMPSLKVMVVMMVYDV
jgi:hypothetical protein